MSVKLFYRDISLLYNTHRQMCFSVQSEKVLLCRNDWRMVVFSSSLSALWCTDNYRQITVRLVDCCFDSDVSVKRPREPEEKSSPRNQFCPQLLSLMSFLTRLNSCSFSMKYRRRRSEECVSSYRSSSDH